MHTYYGLLLLALASLITVFSESENHNLESYDKILNWSSDSDQIILRPIHRVPFLSNNFSYEISYKNNTIDFVL